MKLSVKEAAKAIGMSEDGIRKSISRGTISANKSKKGGWAIDSSELFRVYEPVQDTQDRQKQDSIASSRDKQDIKTQLENTFLKEKVGDLENQLSKAENREQRLQEENSKLMTMANRQTRLLEHHQEATEKTVEKQEDTLGRSGSKNPSASSYDLLWTFIVVVISVVLIIATRSHWLPLAESLLKG